MCGCVCFALFVHVRDVAIVFWVAFVRVLGAVVLFVCDSFFVLFLFV